jgi:hypothetical protein
VQVTQPKITVDEKAVSDACGVANSQNNDGPARILTGDLRGVKTEDLRVFEAFSVGDITVRKANDPSNIV